MKKWLVVAFFLMFVAGSALAAGKTCQTQCTTRVKVQTCTHYCWP
jgi:hypothetical protein